MKITSVSSVVETAALPASPLPRSPDEIALLKSKPRPDPQAVAPEADRHDKPSADLKPVNTTVEAHYSVDQATHQTVIQLVDAGTQEVLRETPTEAIRKLSESLEKLAESQNHQLDLHA